MPSGNTRREPAGPAALSHAPPTYPSTTERVERQPMPIHAGPPGAPSRRRFALARRPALSTVGAQGAEHHSPVDPIPATKPSDTHPTETGSRRWGQRSTAPVSLTVRARAPDDRTEPPNRPGGGPPPGTPAQVAPKWGASGHRTPGATRRQIDRSVGIALYMQAPGLYPDRFTGDEPRRGARPRHPRRQTSGPLTPPPKGNPTRNAVTCTGDPQP